MREHLIRLDSEINPKLQKHCIVLGKGVPIMLLELCCEMKWSEEGMWLDPTVAS